MGYDGEASWITTTTEVTAFERLGIGLVSGARVGAVAGFAALAAQTPPIAGAVELTASLPAGSWSVVTSASRRLAIARWAGAGITPPAKTVTADDITLGKPHPEPFLSGARLLGADPNRCVVFEDSPSGGIAGNAAGATVIAVGDLEWAIKPAARIADLTQVSVSTASDGALLLEVQNRL